MALRTLTTALVIPNINRAEIMRAWDERDDEADPRFILQMRFIARIAGTPVTFRDAGAHVLTARDTKNSNPITLNATPAAFGDVILSGQITQVDNACTQLGDAYDAAYAATVGTVKAKKAAGREAALTKAQEIGLVSAGLASA